MIRILRIRIRIRNTAPCWIVDLPLCALQAAVQKSAAGLGTGFPEVSNKHSTGTDDHLALLYPKRFFLYLDNFF